MPQIIANDIATARFLFQRSQQGDLIEVNSKGHIQTAGLGTRVHDALIGLFQGRTAREAFRTEKAQAVAQAFQVLIQSSPSGTEGQTDLRDRQPSLPGGRAAPGTYESVSRPTLDAIHNPRESTAYRVDGELIATGIGENGKVYHHSIDANSPESVRDALAWIEAQYHKKVLIDGQEKSPDPVAVGRLMDRLGITERFYVRGGSGLDRPSILEEVPPQLRQRFEHDIVDVMRERQARAAHVAPSRGSQLYEQLASGSANAGINIALRNTPMGPDAKAHARLLYDNSLSNLLQALGSDGQLDTISPTDLEAEIERLVDQAIAQAKAQFPG